MHQRRGVGGVGVGGGGFLSFFSILSNQFGLVVKV